LMGRVVAAAAGVLVAVVCGIGCGMLVAGCAAPALPAALSHSVALPAPPDGSQSYLNALADTEFYQVVGSERLLAEGRLVCAAHRRNWTDDQIWRKVATDLSLSDMAAMKVQIDAELYLGC